MQNELDNWLASITSLLDLRLTLPDIRMYWVTKLKAETRGKIEAPEGPAVLIME